LDAYLKKRDLLYVKVIGVPLLEVLIFGVTEMYVMSTIEIGM